MFPLVAISFWQKSYSNQNFELCVLYTSVSVVGCIFVRSLNFYSFTEQSGLLCFCAVICRYGTVLLCCMWVNRKHKILFVLHISDAVTCYLQETFHVFFSLILCNKRVFWFVFVFSEHRNIVKLYDKKWLLKICIRCKNLSNFYLFTYLLNTVVQWLLEPTEL